MQYGDQILEEDTIKAIQTWYRIMTSELYQNTQHNNNKMLYERQEADRTTNKKWKKKEYKNLIRTF